MLLAFLNHRLIERLHRHNYNESGDYRMNDTLTISYDQKEMDNVL